MAKKFFSLERDGSVLELDIYGDIVQYSWFESDTTSYDLASKIKGMTDVDTIKVNINSYGGEVKEGLAIYNALKQSPAKIVTRCDGFACSAASIVFCAGDERIMNESSLLMIHNAWSRAEGDAKALRKQADDLEKITEPSIKAYLSVADVDEDEMRSMMDAETWIDPDEALEMGFATSVVKSKADKASQSVRKKVFQLIKNPYQLDEDPDEKPEKAPGDEPEKDPEPEGEQPDEVPDEEPGEQPGEEPDEDPEEQQMMQFLNAIFK